jgi:4-carboxymuconolactone decarboxylase
MRLSEPRIPPVSDAEATDEQRALLDASRRDGNVLNVVRTLAQYPALSQARGPLTRHIMGGSALPPRERELLILRIGWLCQAEYEFGQHARFGKGVGLRDEEIRRVTEGPDAAGWDAFDATLLRAADELHGDAFISDATWTTLSARYSREQLMDVVFTVGQYTVVSMALNTFGVQFEPGVAGFPD